MLLKDCSPCSGKFINYYEFIKSFFVTLRCGQLAKKHTTEIRVSLEVVIQGSSTKLFTGDNFLLFLLFDMLLNDCSPGLCRFIKLLLNY